MRNSLSDNSQREVIFLNSRLNFKGLLPEAQVIAALAKNKKKKGGGPDAIVG
jgi:hypothetical protein